MKASEIEVGKTYENHNGDRRLVECILHSHKGPWVKWSGSDRIGWTHPKNFAAWVAREVSDEGAGDER